MPLAARRCDWVLPALHSDPKCLAHTGKQNPSLVRLAVSASQCLYMSASLSVSVSMLVYTIQLVHLLTHSLFIRSLNLCLSLSWISVSVSLFVCHSVRLSRSLSVCPSIRLALSVCLSVCVHVCVFMCIFVCLYHALHNFCPLQQNPKFLSDETHTLDAGFRHILSKTTATFSLFCSRLRLTVQTNTILPHP